MARYRFFGGRAQGSIQIGNNAGLLDTETITIGDKTYEWDNNASITPGNVSVTIGGSAAASIVNLRDAINANKPSTPVTAEIHPLDPGTLLIFADGRGAAGNLAFTETMADAANTISGAGNLVGGENAGNQTLHRGQYTVEQNDVDAGGALIETGIPMTPRFVQVDVITSAGAAKYITDLVTIVGVRVQIDIDGATNIAAGDVVNWVVWE